MKEVAGSSRTSPVSLVGVTLALALEASTDVSMELGKDSSSVLASQCTTEERIKKRDIVSRGIVGNKQLNKDVSPAHLQVTSFPIQNREWQNCGITKAQLKIKEDHGYCMTDERMSDSSMRSKPGEDQSDQTDIPEDSVYTNPLINDDEFTYSSISSLITLANTIPYAPPLAPSKLASTMLHTPPSTLASMITYTPPSTRNLNAGIGEGAVLVSHDNKPWEGRVGALEKKIQIQNEEISGLKSALSIALRSIRRTTGSGFSKSSTDEDERKCDWLHNNGSDMNSIKVEDEDKEMEASQQGAFDRYTDQDGASQCEDLEMSSDEHVDTISSSFDKYESSSSMLCTTCGQVVERDSATHVCDKAHMCDVCGKSFKTHQYLTAHSRYHGEKNFSCNVCGKQFVVKSKLVRHMTMHARTRPYLCGKCGLRFSASDKLRLHTARHTGKHQYECPHCGISYVLAYSLRQHLTKHHQQKQHFSCDVCSKTFLNEIMLDLHVKAHSRTVILLSGFKS